MKELQSVNPRLADIQEYFVQHVWQQSIVVLHKPTKWESTQIIHLVSQYYTINLWYIILSIYNLLFYFF